MELKDLSSDGKKLIKLIEFDEEEKLLCEVRKHPFGLFLIYLTGVIVSLVLFGVLVAVALFLRDNNSSGSGFGATESIAILVGIVLTLLALAVTGIAGFLYNSNVLFVTSDKIAQILNKSIFSRKISQLKIGDIQDVTVHQNGVFARIFNYGTIIVETAGEQQNYIFSYSPDPHLCTRIMITAQETDLKKHGN